MTAKKQPRYKLWAVYDQEGKALALATARTEGGAKKKWEDNTGGDRSEIYVEVVDLNKGYFPFTALY